MLNHLCRGHFLIRHHQMSELAGQNLHLDLRLWQPRSVPPRRWPLEKHRSGKKPGMDSATPLFQGSPL